MTYPIDNNGHKCYKGLPSYWPTIIVIPIMKKEGRTVHNIVPRGNETSAGLVISCKAKRPYNSSVQIPKLWNGVNLNPFQCHLPRPDRLNSSLPYGRMKKIWPRTGLPSGSEEWHSRWNAGLLPFCFRRIQLLYRFGIYCWWSIWLAGRIQLTIA